MESETVVRLESSSVGPVVLMTRAGESSSVGPVVLMTRVGESSSVEVFLRSVMGESYILSMLLFIIIDSYELY